MHALESIALIGLRGSGKTALGKKLAKCLGYAFCDTDEVFKIKSGMSIADFVAQNGWDAFRDREEEILLEMPRSGAIISCGGGIVLREANRMLLKKEFFAVFLDVPVKELVRRLSADRKSDQRPAFTNKGLAEEMQELYDARRSFYLEACSFRLTEWEVFEKETATIITEYNKKVKR